MAGRSRLNKAKNRRDGGSFANIPHAVLHSPNYPKLSFKGAKLVLDIAGQVVYRKGGENSNGNLCAALKTMKPMGWKSADTLDAAEAELLHFGFIEVTQKGNRRNPTLYAVTWLAISSFEDKPWIQSTHAPSCKYKIEAGPMPPRRVAGKKLIPDNWVTPYPTIGLNDQKVTTLYPTIGLKRPVWGSFYTRRLGTSIDLPRVLGLNAAVTA